MSEPKIEEPNEPEGRAGGPSASAEKAAPWWEPFLDALEPENPPDLPAGLEKRPKWVTRVLLELLQQTHPWIRFKRGKPTTAREVGQLFGQVTANCFAVEDQIKNGLAAIEADPTHAERLDQILKAAQEGKAPAALGVLNSALEASGALIAGAFEHIERFQANLEALFKAALDQPSHAEASAFFRGYSEGLSKPGTVKGRPAHDTTATDIYGFIYADSAHIETLSSLTELRAHMLTCGFTEQTLGPAKRLEKLCQRVGLTLRKRGRPKKKKSPKD